LNFGFNVRCQFQLKHHWLGKNEKSTNVLSPLLLVSRGFFVFEIVLVVVLAIEIEKSSTRTRRKN
jgi:hypothetical protein